MGIVEKIKRGEIKRYLTTRNRLIFKGAIYHITQRAPGREIVFLEESDYLVFLSILKNILKEYKIDLFSFALLSNHLHLLLRINEENLPESMKHLFQRYAVYFNKKYDRKGHVFCGRYRSSLCNDENYLLAASIYIHLNPYKAGLCQNPEDYQWSSLPIYLKKAKKSFVTTDEILLMLAPEINEASKAYSELLIETTEIPGGNLLKAKSINFFIERTKTKVKKALRKNTNLDELIKKFSSQKRVIKPEDKKARRYLIEQLQADGYLKKEIANLLSIDRKTLYNILNSPH